MEGGSLEGALGAVGCNMREVLQLQCVLQEAMDSNYS